MKLIDKIKNFISKASGDNGKKVEELSVADKKRRSTGDEEDEAMFNSDDKLPADDLPADDLAADDLPATHGDNDTDDDMELELMDLSERIEFEVEMVRSNPNHEPIHLVGSPKILLSAFLQKIGIVIDEQSVSACYVVTDDWAEKSYHTLDNFGEYALFDDMLVKDDDGHWNMQGLGRSVVLHIVYGNSVSQGYLCLHMSSQGYLDDEGCLYNRVSVVHKRPRTDEVNIHKILLTFDINDPQKVLDTIDSIHAKAVEKDRLQQELTQIEVLSLGYPAPFPQTFQSAQQRMNENRWGDAISDLMIHYHIMKNLVTSRQAEEQLIELFARVCFLLSICYYSKQLYTKAWYYASLTCHFTDRAEPQDILKRCLGILRHPQEYAEIQPIHGVYPFALIMESYFDIIPSELSELLWINNQTLQSGTIKKQSDIWKFDIKEAMKDTDNLSLYLSYRSHHAVLDEEFVDMEAIRKQVDENPDEVEDYLRSTTQACVDKSICKVDNVVVAHLTKKHDVITLTVMVPRFKLAGNNNDGYPDVITFKYLDHPAVTAEAYEDIRKRVQQKAANQEKLDDLEEYVLGTDDTAHVDAYNGLIAYRNKMWGDCIYYLSKAYYALSGSWHEGQLDKKDMAMMTTVCYSLGFAYNEVRLYEYALYYLEFLSTSGYIPYMIEYINALTNSQDPRAWSFVQNEYASIMEGTAYQNADEDFKHMYTSFLKRRKGFILIDQHRYAEAKALFTNLLEEPESRELAESELEYIRRCMEEEEN